MQAELAQLRQQATKKPPLKQSPPRQQPTKTSGVPSSKSQTKKFVVGERERERVAHHQLLPVQQNRGVANRGVAVKESTLPDGVYTERYSGIRLRLNNYSTSASCVIIIYPPPPGIHWCPVKL